MPLTPEGRKVKRKFEDRYGEERGERIFFSWLNKKSKSERRKFENG